MGHHISKNSFVFFGVLLLELPNGPDKGSFRSCTAAASACKYDNISCDVVSRRNTRYLKWKDVRGSTAGLGHCHPPQAQREHHPLNMRLEACELILLSERCILLPQPFRHFRIDFPAPQLWHKLIWQSETFCTQLHESKEVISQNPGKVSECACAYLCQSGILRLKNFSRNPKSALNDLTQVTCPPASNMICHYFILSSSQNHNVMETCGKSPETSLTSLWILVRITKSWVSYDESPQECLLQPLLNSLPTALPKNLKLSETFFPHKPAMKRTPSTNSIHFSRRVPTVR